MHYRERHGKACKVVNDFEINGSEEGISAFLSMCSNNGVKMHFSQNELTNAEPVITQQNHNQIE